MGEELGARFQVKLDDIIKDLNKWYNDYLRYYPEYGNYLRMAEIVTEKGVEGGVRDNEFVSLVEKAISTQPIKQKSEMRIYIKPIDGVYPILCWNSDQYYSHFKEEYLVNVVYSKKFSKNRKFLISLMEYYATVGGLTRIAINAVASNYVRELLGIYELPFDQALKKNTRIPLNTLIDRVRKNFRVPKVMDRIMEEDEDNVERPKSRNENMYREMIDTYQAEAPIEIRLTPEEIEEEITNRLLEEIISEDYEEIDS